MNDVEKTEHLARFVLSECKYQGIRWATEQVEGILTRLLDGNMPTFDEMSLLWILNYNILTGKKPIDLMMGVKSYD